jgi:hypothetical protein
MDVQWNLAQAAWWQEVTLVAAALSLALLAIYPSRWFIVGYPISIARVRGVA